MKTTKSAKIGTPQTRYSEIRPATGVLREGAIALPFEEEAMVRTQIYLSRAELEFVQREGGRRGQPMAAIIRQFIDEKMEAPAHAWTNNPMLAPSAEDPLWQGHEDGSINHDHYIYGTPKKFVKTKGKWVEAPPLPKDYDNDPGAPAAARASQEKPR